jgi:hypothetical protein
MPLLKENWMTKEKTLANLAEVKRALAKKYENLARVTKSKPRKKTLMNHADRFLRQAKKAAGE